MMPKLQVFAVMRVDADGPPSPGAVKEVERLNTLNASKSCTYFWMTTRYYPQGRGIDTPNEP